MIVFTNHFFFFNYMNDEKDREIHLTASKFVRTAVIRLSVCSLVRWAHKKINPKNEALP